MSQLVIEKKETSGVGEENIIIEVLVEEQPEGGFTITVPKIPELITEIEEVDEAFDQLIDAFRELYKSYVQENEYFPYAFDNIQFELEIIYL